MFNKNLIVGIVTVVLLGGGALTTNAEVTTGLDPESGAATCPGGYGLENFESGTDGSPIESTIPGVKFTITDGQDWLTGDWGIGYNGKYPDGSYTSGDRKWAWLGASQNSGIIDFTAGKASHVSIYTSTLLGLILEAYADDGTFLESSGWATNNIETGKMTMLGISRPTADIGYVVVHDTGDFWLIDWLCTDAAGTAPPTLSFPPTGPYAGDGVDPNTGDTSTLFTFRAIYTDLDDDTPEYIRLCIGEEGGVPTCLPSVSAPNFIDYRNGWDGAFEGMSWGSPSAGTYSYYFEASDGENTVRLPDSGGFPLRIKKPIYTALGDSFSSGFGIPPYEEGTHQDEGSNNCQRSESAYPKIVAEELGRDLSFHACQGATTKHMYERRIDEPGNDWGELPQLENLDNETELVTLTIGGNDVGFVDVLKECILGAELLPFNTCYSDEKVTRPVQETLTRLDGGDGPGDVKPYDVIFKDIRRLAPSAKGVAVGYPHLFTASGGDRTFLPGGRCEGVKKADQRWMVEKIDELNDIIKRNALRNGLLFALPVFDGHELCSGSEEWIFGALDETGDIHPGAFHPTQNGHQAIGEAVTGELVNDEQKTKIFIEPFQTFNYAFSVESDKALLSFTSEWPGSDIVTSLQSPSGIVYTRNSGNALYHEDGPTWEHYEISGPESGAWTATLYGADVTGTEEVSLSVYSEDAPNQSPVGNVSWRIDDGMLVMDGGRSYDPDGQIISYNWYVTTYQDDEVYVGQIAEHPLLQNTPVTMTLVVTDNRRGTDFVSVTIVPIDVRPGSDVNPVNPKSKGVLPVAILSSAMFDASAIDPNTLRFGPGQTGPVENGVHREDVDNDGTIDLMLQFPIQQLGVESNTSQLCLTGEFPDGPIFWACDTVKIR